MIPLRQRIPSQVTHLNHMAHLTQITALTNSPVLAQLSRSIFFGASDASHGRRTSYFPYTLSHQMALLTQLQMAHLTQLLPWRI